MDRRRARRARKRGGGCMSCGKCFELRLRTQAASTLVSRSESSRVAKAARASTGTCQREAVAQTSGAPRGGKWILAQARKRASVAKAVRVSS